MERLADLLRDLKTRLEASLVVVEHDIPLIGAVADRIVVLQDGRIVRDGAPAQVLRSPGPR